MLIPLPSNRGASIAVILFGTMLYTWVKHVESQQAKSAPSGSGTESVNMKDRDLEVCRCDELPSLKSAFGRSVNGKPPIRAEVRGLPLRNGRH